MFNIFRKSRKYPIKYDEYGRSSRQQAFAVFSKNYRPSQIFRDNLIPVPLNTLLRYFEDWKKQGHRMSRSVFKKYMKEKPEFSEKLIAELAEYFGVSTEQVILRMQKPWGISQLMKGELPDNKLVRAQNENEERLEVALDLIYFRERICRNSPEQIKRLLQEIVNLEDNTMLIISKINRQIMIRKKNLRGAS